MIDLAAHLLVTLFAMTVVWLVVQAGASRPLWTYVLAAVALIVAGLVLVPDPRPIDVVFGWFVGYVLGFKPNLPFQAWAAFKTAVGRTS